jgi:sugar-specific transcriptional regulator TrmB
MTPQEIQALAEELIRDAKNDIAFMTIHEGLPESLPEDEANRIARDIDDLIIAAVVTVTFPDGSRADEAHDAMTAAIDPADYDDGQDIDGMFGEDL